MNGGKISEIKNIDRNIAIGYSCLVLALILVYSIAENTYFTRVIENNSKRLTETITNILADSINRVSFSGRYHSQLFVERIVKNGLDIDYILLAERDGRIFVHSNPASQGQMLDRESLAIAQQVLSERTTSFRSIRSDGKKGNEIIMPYRAGYGNTIAGVMIVGISTEKTENELYQMRRILHQLVALLTLLSLVATYYLGRYFAAPMKNLALRLKGILEHAPLLICITDRNGDLLESSRSFNCAPREYQEKLLLHCRDLKSDEAQNDELEIFQNGGEGVFLTSSFPLQAVTQKKAGQICTIALDVTKPKQNEKALQEREHRQTRILDGMIQYIALLAPDAIILQQNKAAITASGLPDAISAGFPIWNATFWSPTPEARERLIQAVSDASSGRFIRYEADVETISGHETIDFSLNPIRDESGKVCLMVAEGRDITDLKKLEAQLRQSQKMEAIGQLAGGIAHDLNNLLSPILGYGELLQDDLPSSGGLHESVQQIIKAAYRAREIIRQLLAFGRKQILEVKPVDLNEVVEGFAKLLRRTIREDIVIEILPASGVPIVRADIGQIEQVIMNIAVNAQDAMPDGGRMTIKVDLVDLDQSIMRSNADLMPGLYAVLSVIDTGQGMTAAVREKLFTPFFTTKERGKGTGLGLATAYGIIKQHAGTIAIESESGKGACFKIFLPVFDTAVLPDIAPLKTEGSFNGTERIMVVEDNEMVRNLAVRILRHLGYSVVSARCGSECLEMLESNQMQVDLLLTDVVMPQMNGKMLYEKVSALRAGVRVLFMSGYAENLIGQHGMLDDGTLFIQKPFSVASLGKKVRSILDGKA